MKQQIIEALNSYKSQGIVEMTISNILTTANLSVPSTLEDVNKLVAILNELASEGVLSDNSNSNEGWGVTQGSRGEYSFSAGFTVSF
jgi:hypothetical protein